MNCSNVKRDGGEALLVLDGKVREYLVPYRFKEI